MSINKEQRKFNKLNWGQFTLQEYINFDKVDTNKLDEYKNHKLSYLLTTCTTDYGINKDVLKNKFYTNNVIREEDLILLKIFIIIF